MLAAAAQAAGAAERPASYAEFDTSVAASDGDALKEILEEGVKPYVFLRRGRYVLDNPVVIDRDTSLFLHGVDRMHTILVAKEPAAPLFVVKRAPLVSFAGLFFFPTQNEPGALNAQALAARNAEPLALEMLDCSVGHSTLSFEGPGRYHVQAPVLGPGGRVRAAIWVDHPDADVFVFGGDASNAGEPLRTEDFAFVWQKRGRVRIHATTFEANLGQGDVRLEGASKLGPHVIANVRSEGVSGALARSGAVSRFLYVPPTAEKVDVVLKANGGAWDTGPLGTGRSRLNCSMVSYQGAGTLWLVGNRAEGWCGRHIAEGRAPGATIVSVGNLISSPDPFAVEGARIVSASDLFHSGHWSVGASPFEETEPPPAPRLLAPGEALRPGAGVRSAGASAPPGPVVRWIPDGVPAPALGSYADVPPVPEDPLPPPLLRPRLSAALPDMIDVRRAPYRAVGDGLADDTRAIQKALDAQCDGKTPKAIFFPEGTYRLTDTLYLNHHVGGTCRAAFPYGGWIAGAGSARTRLRMDPGAKRGVFATAGLAAATVQGLSFETWRYRPGDPERVNFDVEFHPGYLASQFNTFYDVVFDGGFGGLAFGVEHPSGGACSANAVFGGEFRNAHIGLVSGHANALANGVVASRFVDNDHAMGSWTDLSNQGPGPSYPLPAGGTFFAYATESRGTRVQDFLFAGSANGSVWYFHDYDSDAPRFFASKPTSAPWPITFDHSRLQPRPGARYLFDVASSQGPIFLHSRLTRSSIRLGQTSMGQSYAIKLHSTIPDWAGTVAPAPNGRTDALD